MQPASEKKESFASCWRPFTDRVDKISSLDAMVGVELINFLRRSKNTNGLLVCGLQHNACHHHAIQGKSECILSCALSELIISLVNGDTVSNGYKRSLDLMWQLRRHHFGRFIDISQDFDSTLTEKECLCALECLAVRHHVWSQVDLGICCYYAKGVAKDKKKSAQCFRSTCNLRRSFGISECWFGLCLLDGIGVDIDKSGAAFYFKKSADQGNSGSQWLYGLCLRDGIG